MLALEGPVVQFRQDKIGWIDRKTGKKGFQEEEEKSMTGLGFWQ